MFGLVLKIFIFKNRGYEILPKVSEIFIAFIIGIIFSLNLENIKNLSFILFLCVFLHNTIGLITGYLVGSFFGFSDREKKNNSNRSRNAKFWTWNGVIINAF